MIDSHMGELTLVMAIFFNCFHTACVITLILHVIFIYEIKYDILLASHKCPAEKISAITCLF